MTTLDHQLVSIPEVKPATEGRDAKTDVGFQESQRLIEGGHQLRQTMRYFLFVTAAILAVSAYPAFAEEGGGNGGADRTSLSAG
jgi:hypothetical protein